MNSFKIIDATPEAQDAFNELSDKQLSSYEKTVLELAKLKSFEYDQIRKDQAKALGVRNSTLDASVKAAQQTISQEDAPFTDIEPYSEPIEPAQLLDNITATILRFIVLDKYQAQIAALWVSACWFVDVIHAAPIALINAPEKACGKTQLLTVLGKLSPRSVQASGISPSVLFRMIEAYQPALFIDEIETVLKDNDDLRGLINAGHTRDSAYVWRSVAKGDDFEAKRFTVWGMKAIAGINAIKLAETVTSRSIIFELRRKKSDEKVQRLRQAEPDLFRKLAAKLARFSYDYMTKVNDAQPSLPEALSDRDQDNFEPLLSIAEVAGGHWPNTALKATLKLSNTTLSTQSTANELLADIQKVFKEKEIGKISTADLITALCENEENAWAAYNRGQPLTPRQLARLLKSYNIASKDIRLDDGRTGIKGFDIGQFTETFLRYLSTPLENTHLSATPLQANTHTAEPVAANNNVADIQNLDATPEPTPDKDYSVVAAKEPVSGVAKKEPIKPSHLRI